MVVKTSVTNYTSSFCFVYLHIGVLSIPGTGVWGGGGGGEFGWTIREEGGLEGPV